MASRRQAGKLARDVLYLLPHAVDLPLSREAPTVIFSYQTTTSNRQTGSGWDSWDPRAVTVPTPVIRICPAKFVLLFSTDLPFFDQLRHRRNCQHDPYIISNSESHCTRKSHMILHSHWYYEGFCVSFERVMQNTHQQQLGH